MEGEERKRVLPRAAPVEREVEGGAPRDVGQATGEAVGFGVQVGVGGVHGRRGRGRDGA